MDRNRRDAVAATTNGPNHRHKKKGPPAPFERRTLVNKVKRCFSHSLTSHGALTERVVLYGMCGQGKRRVAAQVAQEITQADGRRIFWINGLTFETFVRDYCLLYHELTGQYLPQGLGLTVTLAKIKHMLEERRQEWLMVITDLGLFSDDEPELASSLPDRGHIIVTSNEIAFRATVIDCQTSVKHPFSPLNFANNADKVHVKTLTYAERLFFARHFCPDLLNISSSEFGPVQQLGHGVLLYLRITAINLRLLRMDFAAYRQLFERQFDSSQVARYENLGEYKLALHIASKILWDALGDHDVWAQRLLTALTIVDTHSVPLRLLRRLSVFAKPITDHLSPALDLLASLGLIIMSNRSNDPSISMMHHEVSRWVWKHVRIRSREEMHQSILSWVSVFSIECASAATIIHFPSGSMPTSTPFDHNVLWQYLPHMFDLANTIRHVGVGDTYIYSPPRLSQRTMVLDFLINVAETFVADRRIPFHAGYFVDEAFKILLKMRYFLKGAEYNSYLVRIKLVQIRAYLAADERIRAEQELRTVKRSLIMLTSNMQDPGSLISNPPSGQQIYQPANTLSLSGNAASTNPSMSSTPAMLSCNDTLHATNQGNSVLPKPSLLTLTEWTFDVEAQLLLSQQRYSQAFFHLLSVLHPTPDVASLADPYILARRYFWITSALIGERERQTFEGEALVWSHAAMCAWTMLDENDRWGKGERGGVEVLAWVQRHVELLMEMRKFKGALLFLPKLLDVWQELTPIGDGKLWRLGRRLVECYVKLDMIREAEKVVERMLEVLNGDSNGMTDLTGLGGAVEGGGYPNETVGDGEGREMFWWMLIELARGYVKVGSVIVAEGIVRFCLGSWRRRHVGECLEIEIIEVPGDSEKLTTSKEEQDKLKPKMTKDVHNQNQEARERRKQRDGTWKQSAPTDWWALLVEVLVMQGKLVEPKKLVEELTMLDESESRHELQRFSKKIEAYRLMTTIYQRAMWAEEQGCLREWKMLLGESRDRFLLRRAVKAFGSVVRRVREKRDFASDIDLNLESHAGHSKILTLLDRVWSHKHGFSPRARWETDDYEEDVFTYSTCDQSYLCKLWLWCQCKKRRSRAWSIDNAELERKRFILEDDRRAERAKPLKQGTLDDWIYFIVPPASRPEGCHDECPCIKANIRGLAGQAALEAKLWTYDEPTNPHRIPMATKVRYKNVKDRSDASLLPGFDFDVERLASKSNEIKGYSSWLWFPPEHSPGDYDGENYIFPTLHLPNITITFVDDEDDDMGKLEEAVRKAEASEKHLRIPTDKALLPSPYLESSAQDRPTTNKRKRGTQKKKLALLKRLYSDSPSIVQSEHIKPYLTMDEKTKAKYAEKAKHANDIVILDEYMIPVVTIPQQAAEVGESAATADGTVETAGEDQTVGDTNEAGNDKDTHESGIDSHLNNSEDESQATIVGSIQAAPADDVGGDGYNDS